MSVIDVRALLTGDLSRMGHVTRYSSVFTNHKESSAEHSFYVTLFSMVIALWCEDNKGDPMYLIPKIDQATLFRKSLVHDTEESRTGDLFRTFKYSNPEFKKMVDEISGVELGKLWDDIVPRRVASRIGEIWRSSKDETPEGRIVALADFMSVVHFTWREVSVGNTLILHNVPIDEHIRIFDGPSFEFLRPILRQLQDIVDGICCKGRCPNG